MLSVRLGGGSLSAGDSMHIKRDLMSSDHVVLTFLNP